MRPGFLANWRGDLDINISDNCESFDNNSGRSDFGSAGFSGGFVNGGNGDGGGIPIPEPGTVALLSIGAISLASLYRQRLKAD